MEKKIVNKIINIQTGEELDWDKVVLLPNNTLLKYRPDLFELWHFKKNDELDIDIYDMTHKNDKVAWWFCKKCDSEYESSIKNRNKAKSPCPYCSGQKINHTNSLASLRPDLASKWHPILNGEITPHDILFRTVQSYWWKCGKCNSDYESVVRNKIKAKKSTCPYCRGLRVNNTNSLASLRPDLASQWHPTKNKISPKDVTCNMTHEVWWICDKCGSDYQANINNRNKGSNCSYCSGRKVNHTNSLASLNPKLAKEWHPTKNGDKTPHNFVCGSNEEVWWKCSICNSDYKKMIGARNCGIGCGVCSGHKILIGFNDLWTTNKPLASMLLNPNEGYTNTYGSSDKVDLKCQECGTIIRNKKISEYAYRLPKCPKCGDGKSTGEKIMYSVLDSLGVDFYVEKVFDWLKTKRYDFYVPSLNMIIETHGAQHYIEGRGNRKRTLAEEQANDRYKEKMAKENGIKHYIIIDCRKSDFHFIKNSILNSKLSSIFDLNSMDWDLVIRQSSKSMLLKATELYNSGMDVSTIMDELKLSRTIITIYLNKSTKFGWCNYNGKEEVRKSNLASSKPVVQLSLDGEYIATWDTVNEAVIGMNRKSYTSIYKCLNGQLDKAHGFKWMLLSKYEIS